MKISSLILLIVFLFYGSLNVIYCQNDKEYKYSIGSHFQFRFNSSSIEVDRYIMPSVEINAGRFINPGSLIGIDFSFSGSMTMHDMYGTHYSWVSNGFYRKQFENYFIKLAAGYGKRGYIYYDDDKLSINIFNFDAGFGIIINVSNAVKIPVQIGYRFRTYFYPDRVYAENQFLNTIVFSAGINLYLP